MTISHTKGSWNSSNTSYPKKALRQYSHRYETTRNKNVHYSFVSDIEKRINNLNVYQKADRVKLQHLHAIIYYKNVKINEVDVYITT